VVQNIGDFTDIVSQPTISPTPCSKASSNASGK
jgi:hypothetical protein